MNHDLTGLQWRFDNETQCMSKPLLLQPPALTNDGRATPMQSDCELQLGVGYRSEVNVIGYGDQVRLIDMQDILCLFVQAICDTDYGRWNTTPDILAMRTTCMASKRVVDIYMILWHIMVV